MIETIKNIINKLFYKSAIVSEKSPKQIADEMHIICMINIMQARSVEQLIDAKNGIKEYSNYCIKHKIPNKENISKLRKMYNQQVSSFKRNYHVYKEKQG